MPEARLSYRPDIDGLRALAIVSVVAYHVGLPGVPGGFVGVDVFFVISGFLITGLLLKEIRASGTVDLLDFYARRARRLLPAIFVMLAATSVLAVLFLVPIKKDLSRFANSAINAALYVSNFFFARTRADYFAGPADTLPLLHTWSLAVEEQFYIIWPCLLFLFAYLTRSSRSRLPRLVLAVLTVIFCTSLAASWWAASSEGKQAQAGFYLIFSRAWELAIGAFLAAALPYVAMRSRILGEALSALGLGAVIAAVTTFDPTMPYPGVAALLPTLGTAALIAGGTLAPQSWPARLLASPPAVGIGLVSYSWYLWHWPLLAMARDHALGARDLPRDIALGVLALGLAWLTYRFIEKPIRERHVWAEWSSRKVLGAAAAATVLITGSAATIRWWEHRTIHDPSSRFARLHQAVRDVNPRQKKCNHGPSFTNLVAWEACASPPGGSGRHVMVWGDSHGDHLMPLLEAVAPRAGLGVSQRTMNGCSPLLGFTPFRQGTSNSECALFNQAVLNEIRERRRQGLVGVVLGGRWVTYDDRPALSVHEQSARRSFNRQLGDVDSSLAGLEAALKRTLATLAEMGLRVVVMAPVPEQRFNAPWCLARRDPAACSVTRQEAEDYRADAFAALSRAVATVPSARLVDPFNALCDTHVCPVERGNAVLYVDDDHLSATAARSLAPWFAEAAAWLAGPGRVADADRR